MTTQVQDNKHEEESYPFVVWFYRQNHGYVDVKEMLVLRYSPHFRIR